MCRVLTVMLAAFVYTAAMAQEPGGWRTDPRSGCKVWAVDPRPDTAVTWSGGCDPAGYATGRGVQELRIGEQTYRYEGEYRDGKRNGAGVLLWPNGDRYEGNWRDDRQNGAGALAWSNGNRYEGDWQNGVQSGRGVFTWRAGQRYEGDFKDGILSGRGVFVAKNGNRYDGQFRDGRPEGHGEGVLAGRRYVGVWAAGCIKDGDKKAAFFRPVGECP